MVEADTDRQREQSDKDAHHQVFRSASPMTLQGEKVLASPKDGFDPLPDRSEMRTLLFLIGSSRPSDGGSHLLDLAGKLPARIALVTDDGLPTPQSSGQHEKGDFSLRPVGGSELDGSGSPIRSAGQMQPTSPKPAGVAAGISISADISQRRAPHGLQRAAAFDRGRIKEQEIVFGPGTLGTEEAKQPLDGFLKTSPALVVSILSGKEGKQVPDLPRSGSQETTVRGDAHENLSHSQRDDLGIGGPTASVSPSLWQKIIRCAINDGAEGVEVGVHRGLRVDGVLDTVGFGSSASNPFLSVMFMASII
jgi:hypothetical protein